MKFLITVLILKASGFQEFECEAEDEKDALKKWNNGDIKFMGEEIEVTSVGKPKIEQFYLSRRS